MHWRLWFPLSVTLSLAALETYNTADKGNEWQEHVRPVLGHMCDCLYSTPNLYMGSDECCNVCGSLSKVLAVFLFIQYRATWGFLCYCIC